MSRPYSLDLRERAVALVVGGRSRREVARFVGGWRGERDTLVSARPGNREPSGQADGPAPWPIDPSAAARLASGADRRRTGLDLARGARRAGGAQHQGELQSDLELLPCREGDVQKKACTPPSRIGRTWRAGGHSGRSTKAGLIP